VPEQSFNPTRYVLFVSPKLVTSTLSRVNERAQAFSDPTTTRSPVSGEPVGEIDAAISTFPLRP
jgi:hypothetical protein